MNNPSGADSVAIKLAGVVLDSPDPRALADFYSRLLEWPIDDYDLVTTGAERQTSSR